MNAKGTAVATALVAITLWGVACSVEPIMIVTPEGQQVSSGISKQASPAPLPSASAEQAIASPTSRQTSTLDVVATPTPTSDVETVEEDCMALCHIPDPNDFFAAGAMPLPASHSGSTTCLNCHTTVATPALPDTHVGRLNESCRGCHADSTLSTSP